VRTFATATTVPGEVVIPVLQTSGQGGLEVKGHLQGYGKYALYLCLHKVELAIAATFYKAQGRTLFECIADLNNPPSTPKLSFADLFVWLSRVGSLSRNRILPLVEGQTWDHISKLRPNQRIVAYFKGIGADGMFDAKAAQLASLRYREECAAEAQMMAAVESSRSASGAAKRGGRGGSRGGTGGGPRGSAALSGNRLRLLRPATLTGNHHPVCL
jgi:hypothetical protein